MEHIVDCTKLQRNSSAKVAGSNLCLAAVLFVYPCIISVAVSACTCWLPGSLSLGWVISLDADHVDFIHGHACTENVCHGHIHIAGMLGEYGSLLQRAVSYPISRKLISGSSACSCSPCSHHVDNTYIMYSTYCRTDPGWCWVRASNP